MKSQITMDKSANQLGFYSAIFMTVITLITFGIAISTPPFSGPYCQADCFEYPYAGIDARFPRDYIWMYPAILLGIGYVVLMVCIHHFAAPEKKLFSQSGLVFALMAGLLLILDYFIQVSVIPPSTANAETDGIALFSQFNPHGIFIALEDLGYLLMSGAFLFFAPVFSGKAWRERVLKWMFIGNFVLTMLGFALIWVQYGIEREYRFEVLALSVNWLTLIIGGVLLAGVFKADLSRN